MKGMRGRHTVQVIVQVAAELVQLLLHAAHALVLGHVAIGHHEAVRIALLHIRLVPVVLQVSILQECTIVLDLSFSGQQLAHAHVCPILFLSRS